MTVAFQSVQAQLTVFVDSVSGWLSQVLYLPPSLKGSTAGLLGTWNDNTADDFTLPNGTSINTSSSMEAIHYQFGQAWTISPATSLFTYDIGTTFATYNDRNFRPAFTPQFRNSALQTQAQLVCGSNTQCLFDVATSGNVSFAGSSLVMQAVSQTLAQAFLLPPVFSQLIYTQSANLSSNGAFTANVTVAVSPPDTSYTIGSISMSLANISGMCSLVPSAVAGTSIVRCTLPATTVFPVSFTVLAVYNNSQSGVNALTASAQASVIIIAVCNANQYMSSISYSANVTCAPISTCIAEAVPPTATSDRVCVAATTASDSSTVVLPVVAGVLGGCLLVLICLVALLYRKKQ